MAGAEGFEPTNGGTKNRCLTTWRRPSKFLSNLTIFWHECKRFFMKDLWFAETNENMRVYFFISIAYSAYENFQFRDYSLK